MYSISHTSCSGPAITIQSYEIVFDKDINYCNEISDLFLTIRPTIWSSSFIYERPKELSITLQHTTNLVAKETDLLLLYFTATYYDCFVKIRNNEIHKYTFRVIDGDIKDICYVD